MHFETGNIQKPIIIQRKYRNPRYPLGQCDACPPADFTNSRKFHGSASRFFTSQGINMLPLGNGFHTAFGPLLYSGPVVVNDSAKMIWESFSRPEAIHSVIEKWSPLFDRLSLNRMIKKFFENGLIQNENDEGIKRKPPNRTLTVAIPLTNQCRLNCRYCYCNGNNKKMKTKTGLSIIRQVFLEARHHNFHRISIKYTGGEALLNYPLLVKLHKQANRLSEKTGIELEENVLSNGTTINKTIANSLKRFNMRLMISLDGIGGMQDIHRSYKNGDSSFNDVIKGIRNAVLQNLIPDISVTISSLNLNGINPLVSKLLDEELPFSLNFFKNPAISLKDQDTFKLPYPDAIGKIKQAYRLIEEKMPDRCLLGSLCDRINLAYPHFNACGACSSYLAFDVDGMLSKCHMDIVKTDWNFGVPCLVNWVRNATSGIQPIDINSIEECSKCAFKYYCGGGCPMESFYGSAGSSRQKEKCKIYKELIPEIIRLEGKRLIMFE